MWDGWEVAATQPNQTTKLDELTVPPLLGRQGSNYGIATNDGWTCVLEHNPDYPSMIVPSCNNLTGGVSSRPNGDR